MQRDRMRHLGAMSPAAVASLEGRGGMSAAPEAAERQKIVDELGELNAQFQAQADALWDRCREARNPIQDRCGALGHVFAVSSILRHRKACVICGTVKPE